MHYLRGLSHFIYYVYQILVHLQLQLEWLNPAGSIGSESTQLTVSGKVETEEHCYYKKIRHLALVVVHVNTYQTGYCNKIANECANR